MSDQDFHTQKGYELKNHAAVTAAMEDYLEMICRQADTEGYARVNFLAERLNVRPSSASKMVYQLRALELVSFEKYGLITPTDQGAELGRYLLRRHNVLHRFFCLLNGTDDQLEQVEQVEHYITPQSLESIEGLLPWLEARAEG